MSYQIVSVSRRGGVPNAAREGQEIRCVDGRPLRAGTYASQVKPVLSAHEANATLETLGFHAVLWPMDQHAPLYEERPQRFGPFASRARALAFILEVGTEVQPTTAARQDARVRASPVESHDAGSGAMAHGRTSP